MTVDELVRDATERLASTGIETARLDAELLLASVLDIDRTGVIAHPTAPVGDGAAERFANLLGRRLRGEPLAYLRGVREFRGLALGVDPRALVPRPETEVLVELAEAEIVGRLTERPRPPDAGPLLVADVGTGSGAIAIALAVALRRRRMADHVEFVALDVSADALELARENAVGHGVADRVRFREADLVPPDLGRPIDVCCANLPYVTTGELDAAGSTLGHEPRGALDGGPDGLDVIRRLLPLLPAALATDGVALLEIGSGQGDRVGAAMGDALPGWRVEIRPDLAGHPRVAMVRPPHAADGAAR